MLQQNLTFLATVADFQPAAQLSNFVAAVEVGRSLLSLSLSSLSLSLSLFVFSITSHTLQVSKPGYAPQPATAGASAVASSSMQAHEAPGARLARLAPSDTSA